MRSIYKVECRTRTVRTGTLAYISTDAEPSGKVLSHDRRRVHESSYVSRHNGVRGRGVLITFLSDDWYRSITSLGNYT